MIRRYTIISIIFYLISSLFYFSSCQKNSKIDSEKWFSWTDSYGREISLKEKPQRIVSLSPALTEMIFLLKSEEKLVGISDFCSYPAETAHIPKVGGIQNFNIESLIALNPDVVLIGSIVTRDKVLKMEKLGLPVIAIKEENHLTGIFHAIEILGEIVGEKELASEKVNELQQRIEEVRRVQVESDKLPSVYYVVGFGEAGDFTAPKESHIHEVITLAGGENIGETLTGWSISREFLFQKDPDFIFIRKEDIQYFAELFPYTELSAVKKGNLYPIESGWIDIVSPRNILAVEYMNTEIRR